MQFCLCMLFRQSHAEIGRKDRPSVMVVTGDVRQGKTTFLKNVLRLLVSEGISAGGFLALGVHENDERTGFDLLDIAGGQTTPLCSIRPLPGAVQTGRYYFLKRAWTKAGRC